MRRDGSENRVRFACKGTHNMLTSTKVGSFRKRNHQQFLCKTPVSGRTAFGMLKKLMLVLLFCSVLSPPSPAAASSQVAVILFFCSIAAVVPGPWQQPLQYISSQKDTLIPGISFFLIRLLLVALLASLLQKLMRFDAQKFASLSLYAVPAMSVALLVDQSHRQPLIDALSLSSATSFVLNACHSALPASSYLDTISRITKLLQQRLFASATDESELSDESNSALATMLIVPLLLLVRILWHVFKKSIGSLDCMTLLAIFLSQLSALFILPRVPDLRSALGCVLCMTQLLTAPHLRHRSLPFPTEKNRILFIVCVIPIAMAYSSRGVELSVFVQAVLDTRALLISAKRSSNGTFRFYLIFAVLFVLIFLTLDVFNSQFATSYVLELITLSYEQLMQLNLTFTSIFVLSWGPNYDAGFPSLLVLAMTILLPSLKG
jgi:hypothetical protein